ncbi:MAG: hypothetical protein ACE5HV_17825, partial [Acidobacteriota bacterium]
AGWVLRSPGGILPASPAHLSVNLPGPLDNSGISHVPLAISPEGRRLVFVIQRGSSTQLYLREIDGEEATAIPGTQGGRTPFFSPDGNQIGYFSGNSLMRISIESSGFGVPLQVAATEGLQYGASWGEDSWIYFVTNSKLAPLRVRESGGPVEEIRVAEGKRAADRYGSVRVLPGGGALLVSVYDTEHATGQRSVAVLSLTTGQERILAVGTGPRYLASGHLMWGLVSAGIPTASIPVMVAPFDLDRLELDGPAVPLSFRVSNSIDGRPYLVASRTGTMVYATAVAAALGRLTWVERDGSSTALGAEAGSFADPRLSPDGRRVAFNNRNFTELRILDLDRAATTLLRAANGMRAFPVWSSDGGRMIFMASPKGSLDIYSASADGTGDAELVLHTDNTAVPLSLSRRDGTLFYYEVTAANERDIWALPPGGEPQPLLTTPANERAPMISPDGRFLAYVANEEGRDEVYVRPYPETGSRFRISSDGGTEPLWRRDGRELFFRNGDRMMAVAIETEPSFRAGRPETLFESAFVLDQFGNPNYDVSPDGRRFLMIEGTASTTTQVPVIVNWFEELRRLAPPRR